MPQTTFQNEANAAFAGTAPAELGPKKFRSAVNEGSAELPFGVMVAAGTNPDEQGTELSATSDDLLGIVAHSHNFQKDNELGDTGLKQNVEMKLLTHGTIYVHVEETVAVGDAVRVRAVATGGEQAGDFRTSADGTDCIDISAFARWIKGASADGVAVLELDMTGSAGAVAD